MVEQATGKERALIFPVSPEVVNQALELIARNPGESMAGEYNRITDHTLLSLIIENFRANPLESAFHNNYHQGAMAAHLILRFQALYRGITLPELNFKTNKLRTRPPQYN